jgi:glutamate formiminotransferase/formiminotetrahydrofolate cyclodeaminase
MVALLTYGKRQWEHLDHEMREMIPPIYTIVDEILPLVEKDTDAFNAYVVRPINSTLSVTPVVKLNSLICDMEQDAIRESKNPESEQAQAALLEAIQVPMELGRKLSSLWTQVEKVSQLGNPNCLSDIQV